MGANEAAPYGLMRCQFVLILAEYFNSVVHSSRTLEKWKQVTPTPEHLLYGIGEF